jgi:hypothetical protein
MVPCMRAASSPAATAVQISPDPAAELSGVRSRARAAYLSAKKRNAAPAGLLDRWHADTLTAALGAPERVQVILFHRAETLFALLLDRQKWLAPEKPRPPPISLRGAQPTSSRL